MANVAVGIKDLLVTAGVGVFGATSGWGIYIGKKPDKPHSVVSVLNVGGIGANPKWLLDFPSIQVMVRGDPNGYVAAQSKAQEVKDALLGLPSQDVNGDRFVSIVMFGDIANLGFDENNRVELSLNFSLIVEPATGTNRLPL